MGRFNYDGFIPPGWLDGPEEAGPYCAECDAYLIDGGLCPECGWEAPEPDYEAMASGHVIGGHRYP